MTFHMSGIMNPYKGQAPHPLLLSGLDDLVDFLLQFVYRAIETQRHGRNRETERRHQVAYMKRGGKKGREARRRYLADHEDEIRRLAEQQDDW